MTGVPGTTSSPARLLMNQVSSISKRKLLILLIIVCQPLITGCAKKVYPETSINNISTPAEKQKMVDFVSGGIEKVIDIRDATPDEIINTARQYLGVPHCMGGTTMKCMDCSGLLVTVFAGHGIQLPHSSEEQARYGKIITRIEDLRKGDMVFFIKSYRTNNFITHSGIFLGDNKFIHTSSSDGVTITSLDDPWWNDRYLFGTRVFK
jgi:murein DD-endopeptidase / murein LD-carboxypeptidase